MVDGRDACDAAQSVGFDAIEEQVIRLQKEKQTLAAAVLTSGPGSTAALQRMIARAGDGGAASR